MKDSVNVANWYYYYIPNLKILVCFRSGWYINFWFCRYEQFGIYLVYFCRWFIFETLNQINKILVLGSVSTLFCRQDGSSKRLGRKE